MSQWTYDPAGAGTEERSAYKLTGDPLTDPIPGFPARGDARAAPAQAPAQAAEPAPAQPATTFQGWTRPAAPQSAPRAATEETGIDDRTQAILGPSPADLHRGGNPHRIPTATWGWRGRVRRWSGGAIKPAMGSKEVAYENSRALIRKDFSEPRTIAFVNPKGGAAKTTGVLAAGFTFGTVRGGGVVAWDNNETRGTLGLRGNRGEHDNTTRELLEDLGRFKEVYQSGKGDLGAFVRSQGDAQFDVLASDERPDVTGTIHADDFHEVHDLLRRRYEVVLVDTGNNVRAENWLAAAAAADLLVVTSTVREDTGYSGLWMLDALEDAGYKYLKYQTITVLSDPSPMVDPKLASDLEEVYEKRTRAVYRVPYDPALVAGSVVPYSQLSQATTRSWFRACAGMAAAL